MILLFFGSFGQALDFSSSQAPATPCCSRPDILCARVQLSLGMLLFVHLPTLGLGLLLLLLLLLQNTNTPCF